MHPLVRLIAYASSYRVRMIMASFCTALSTLFDMLPDLLIGVAVDAVIKKNNSLLASFGFPDVKHQLVILGLVALLIWMLEAVFEYLYARLWRKLAQTIQHKLRVDAYNHVQNLEMSYHETVTTGGLVSVINDDINQLERFLDVGAYKFIYLITTMVIVCSVFAYLAPKLVIFAFLPMPLIIAIVVYFKKMLAPRYARVRARVAALAHRITQNMLGIAMIKSYTGEAYELNRLRHDSKAYQEANNAAIALSAAFLPTVRMVVVIAFTMTVMLGGWQVLDGLLDVGAYSILVFQTQRLLWPATECAEFIDLYERAMASAQRVFAILDVPLIHHEAHHEVAHGIKGDIIVDHVTFHYEQSKKPIFTDISLQIPAGSSVAFVGSTGSGKSTLIKLLLRFYDPQQGAIYFDGIKSTSLSVHDVRRSIALVSQDVFLFNGTVKENIAYGTFDASDDAIKHAALVAQADEFIMQLPRGYDTVLGERGLTLSGGQRQRISIARAVLKNPPIFIFDEATSSVDSETESAILRSLQTITQGHTVIMVAHRLSTICTADTIFVMDKGVIVQAGTHAQLLAMEGLYRKLWRVQTGGMLEGDVYVQAKTFGEQREL